MSSNLPVLWVPPVTPPDPDERPPKRRGNLGVILAAVAIVGLPLGAWATWTRTAGAPADAASTAKVAEVETAAPAKPETPAARAEPAPSTSGGNLPYIARPTQPTAPAPTPAPSAAAPSAPAAGPSPAPAATAEAPAPLGPDGRPVRVIGIDKRTGDMTDPATAAPPTRVAEPEKPAAAPAPSSAPAAPSAAVEPATPRGSIVETAPSQQPAPQPPVAVAPQPSTPEKPAVAVQEPAPVIAPPSAAPTVITPPVEASRPAVPAPKSAETKPVEPKAKPVPPKREAVRAPSRDEDIPRADGGGDFADRLAAIRREEARRAVERPRYVPPPEDDDEEIVVVPRPRWGWQPPVFFDDRPHGPVLRPFERPSREAASRDPVGENCHYHAWPTEDMAFHRQVQCHWHRDPRDPSLRYVR